MLAANVSWGCALNTSSFRLSRVLIQLLFFPVILSLAACSGDKGNAGAPGANGLPLASNATALTLEVTSVVLDSGHPVVDFKVSNQDGTGVTGLTSGGLRFTIAKLIPGLPTHWQNYVLTTQTGKSGSGVGRVAVQATRENNGTLVDNNDGSYRYTFNTDIAAITCPDPCKDAYGNALDVSYQAEQTHRLGMQTAGGLPAANAVYTFRPSDGATTGILTRDIVKTDKCNECHDKITAHDARVDTRYCVLCHNPGSQDPDSADPAKDTTPDLQPSVVRASGAVDFKILIHKIHRGENLPSVKLGPDLQALTADDGSGEYAIWGYNSTKHDFSDIAFPQDLRNCDKCHSASDADTPEGDNWKTMLSMEACGSCHDNVKFGVAGLDAGGSDANGHDGGVVADNSECITCHASDGLASTVELAHTNYAKLGGGKFKFEILKVCGADVVDGVTTGAAAACPPATTGPVVVFRVSDPSGGTHAFGNYYDVRSTGTDPEFTTASVPSLNVLMAWNTMDYNNSGATGTKPSRANSVKALTSATSNGDGTFNIVMPDIPAASALVTGTGVVAIEGHPASVGATGAYTEKSMVKAQVAYFGITDGTPVKRRQVIDITTKCDRCHDLLSVHGNNRSDEAQLCVMCHNPFNTDYNARPKDAVTKLLTGTGSDGKDEESVDFKRLIHGIHAAAKTNHDGTDAHGFRDQGLLIYPHDYSHVRFPGVLNKCETCHLPDTFKLMDRTAAGGANWEAPAQNGIEGSTISTIPNATDLASVNSGLADREDDLKISPTAAVCSSCHDGIVEKTHMILNGGLFAATRADIAVNIETCEICHGPGRIASVEYVHSQEFGENIP